MDIVLRPGVDFKSVEENGLLSNVITEVMSGVAKSQQVITENHTTPQSYSPPTPSNPAHEAQRRKILGSIGQSAYNLSPEKEQKLNNFKQNMLKENAFNGVNIFEGTEPLEIAEEKDKAEASVDLSIFGDWQKDIAEKIMYLLNNPREMERMGLKGKQKALYEFNWELESTKLVNLYRELSA